MRLPPRQKTKDRLAACSPLLYLPWIRPDCFDTLSSCLLSAAFCRCCLLVLFVCLFHIKELLELQYGNKVFRILKGKILSFGQAQITRAIDR